LVKNILEGASMKRGIVAGIIGLMAGTASQKCGRGTLDDCEERSPESHAGSQRSNSGQIGAGYRLIAAAISGLVLCSIGIGATTAAASCLSLSALSLPDTLITAAQSITAGTYIAPDGTALPNLPAFCRIAATLTPTPDSNIKIEVWMP